jgi:glycosyltransferase involved in cell wall biosynthesis
LIFLKKIFFKILIKLSFYKANECISNSKYISNEYNRIYNLNFKTIYPPSFDGRIFKKKFKSTKNKIYFGTICRLSREKNLSSLIKVLSNFKNKFFLEIIGDGPEKQKLINLRKKLNLEKQIKFTGKISPDKIKTYFKKFDFYLNSSDFEGFPNTVVEALSHNVPVIASQSYGGINEILKGKKFGYIYKNQNQLKNILNKIISKKIKFTFNQTQLLKHLKQFSEINNIKKYNNLFQQLK